MKKIVIFLILLFVAVGAQAQESQKALWMKANNDYLQAAYPEALAEYLKIEEMGYSSASLYYNIGNTYFKLNNIARSVLYYERALKLDPSDDDIANNLALAKEYTLDRIEEVPDFIVKTWLRDINYSVSSDGWSYISLVLFALAALLLLYFRFGPGHRTRKVSFFAAMAAILLALGAFSFAWTQRRSFVMKDTALIMKPVSTVRSSPDNSGNTLFILHEGTKVKILEKLGEWTRIELADGRQGWLISIDVEVI
jgi:tetratricopeptide (TPR) repeat protein